MNNKKIFHLITALFVLLLISACGAKASSGPSDSVNSKPPEASQGNAPSGNEQASADPEQEILIVIDQTPKPIEGNSFDFVLNKVPEGYMMTEMQWLSDKSKIVNTVQEAAQHGGNGEDGFYISGDGQFSGFFYPDTMKGEKGQVIFLFKNDQGKELTWKKEITLS
ncbi:lipoprotein [Cohnella lupini]|uniref:DUF4352 domain-containing protein n=1 Tax=Cohnella lupini TaxID=1294267 RepID=A0A3D9IUH5_9BACL|nr:hypothetical protein [Cohnella lupini]RED64776.1 hypothetical protein DFP95_102197 [Cohnella lupini]